MSPPENVPPPPLSDHGGRRVRWLFRVIGGLRVVCAVVSLTVPLALAFRPPPPVTPASTMGALVIPGSIREFREPEALFMRAAFAAPARGAPAGSAPAVVPTFVVGDGEFTEPEVPIATQIDGKDTIVLQHQWLPGKEIEVPVTELKLVSRNAKQTAIGVCAGKRAERQGNLRTRNRVFLRQWRVACAAFTGFCCRPCGRPGMSYVAHTQYQQLRKRGAKLVASKASTRYAPFYPYFKRGDYLFFWKTGSRIGHCEVSMGGGWTVGTSSSAGYVARRRVGNRGFRTFSVVRL